MKEDIKRLKGFVQKAYPRLRYSSENSRIGCFFPCYGQPRLNTTEIVRTVVLLTRKGSSWVRRQNRCMSESEAIIDRGTFWWLEGFSFLPRFFFSVSRSIRIVES